MKTLKQAREDRLARLAAQRRRKSKALTPKQFKKLQKDFKETFKKIANRICPHGIGFLGYSCMVCSAGRIADELREQWAPTPTYYANVYIKDRLDEPSRIQVNIKTRTPTQKIMEMQEHGFWYMFDGKPVFITPGMIAVVQLDRTVRNPGYSDQPVSFDEVIHEAARSFRR